MNHNKDDTIYHSTYEDYGKGWLTNEEKNFEELGKDQVKLQYLEKSYKSMMRKNDNINNQTVNTNNNIKIENNKNDKNRIIKEQYLIKKDEPKYPNISKSQDIFTNNEKYKYDKNAIISKPFPFKASEFRYPNEGQEKPKTLFITTNDTYGKIKPNDLELPDKYYPKNTSFTKQQGFLMYRNNSLNCSSSYSKVHPSLDSVV